MSSHSPLRPRCAAIYARYSTDEQRPESIEDQIVTGRRCCETNGWTVAAVYADAAMTGSTADRPQYQRLLADVDRGAIDVLVVESLDRLSRRLSDVASLYDRLNFRRVKLFAADRGEITSLMVGMLGTMAQAFLDDLRHKTKRGMRGKILSGLSAGALGYAYAVNPAVKGGRTVIEDEAQVVRRIFAMYADGASPRAIASKLNVEAVPGPAGRPWVDTTVRGQVERGTGLLNNSAYVGRLEWNRCSYVRNPATGKRVARPNPRHEWEVMDVPELRIVDDALWQRVKARQDEVRTEMARDEHGQPLNRAHRAKHLLSGLIYCGVCAEPFAMRDAEHYGCRNFRSKGTCANSRLIARADLERTVAGAIREHWLSGDTLRELTQSVAAILADRAASAGADKRKLDASLARARSQIDRVVAAITDAGHSKPLIDKLAALEAEAGRLAAEIEAISQAVAPPPAVSQELAEFAVKTFFDRLEDLLAKPDDPHLAAFRNAVREMIDWISVDPEDGELSVVIHGRVEGLLFAAWMQDDDPAVAAQQKTLEAEASRVMASVVAGAGFEPAAFRL